MPLSWKIDRAESEGGVRIFNGCRQNSSFCASAVIARPKITRRVKTLNF